MARPIAAFDGVAACTVVAAVARVSVAVAPIFSHELIGAVRDSDIIGGGGLTDLFHVPTELKEQDVDCGGYHHGDRTIRHLVSEPICQRKVIIDEGCRVDREALVQHDPS